MKALSPDVFLLGPLPRSVRSQVEAVLRDQQAVKEREAMEHYERLVAMIKNAPSEPPRLLMELAAMRPGPIEKAFRAPKRLGLKAVRWIDRRLLKYLEAGRCRPSRPVSQQDHRGARQEPD